MNKVNRSMIIGEEKVKMSESDFIGLCTRLGNDNNICPFDSCGNSSCAECWAEVLNEHIEVK